MIKWKVDFDAKTENLENVPIWARLPIQPLILWSDDVFKEIRNALGFLYEVDNLFKITGYMGMDHIMVGLEFSKGLTNSIIIRKGSSNFCQGLDYEDIPFKSDHYHSYGHLTMECPLPLIRKIWVLKGFREEEAQPLSPSCLAWKEETPTINKPSVSNLMVAH
jgi:hypothetical protein